MELKKLVKSTSFLVISKTVQFAIGLIRSKLAAIYIGTTGVGIFTQVSYLVTMISNLSLLSMNDGLVKQIAQNKESENFRLILKGFMKSYIVLISLACSISIIICLFFSKTLTIFFLGDEKYLLYYLFGITCIPITIINSLSFALLKGYKATKFISRSNITSSVVTILFFIPLIYFFKTTGAVISVAINFFVLLLINNYQARKQILLPLQVSFKEILHTKTQKKYFKELVYFAFFGATTGFVFLISESVCRSIVINYLGISKFGIYSPIISWSTLFSGFILPSLSIYLYPRFSECKSNQEIVGILNDSLRLISFIMIPILFISIPFCSYIIPLFYSKDFNEAAIYLPWHFIGLLFYMWWYSFSQVLTPTGRMKTHGFYVIIMSIINVLVVLFLVPLFGLYGWMFKFIVTPVIFSFIYFFILRKYYRFMISKENIYLMIYLLLISIILIFVDNFIIKYFICFVSLFLSFFLLNKSEKTFLLNKIKGIIK